MSNPFQQHRSALFAERESIDAALHYVHEIIGTLTGADKAAAMTAMMVLVNTAAKVWPETPAPVPDDVAQVRAALAARADDAQASELSLVRADLDARLAALADRVAGLENVDKALESWAEDNIDRHIENWADTYLDDRIETWTSSNLDIEDDVREEVRNVLRDVTVSLDL